MSPAAKRRRVESATGASLKHTSSNLPIARCAKAILHGVQSHDVLLVVGSTGSGKTTLLPQILLDALYSSRPAKKFVQPRIVVTQPRRVAAITVATRVASERQCVIGGDEVGYAVRFDDRTTPNTALRYVTDGVLLRTALSDDGLSSFTHVIIDEIHERSVSTDVVLGVAQRQLAEARSSGTGKRPPFRLVVMSATTDVAKLRVYFEKASLSVAEVNVPGRLHPVDTLYTAKPVPDFVDAAVTAALQVHVDYPLPGDILIFLPGQEEILSASSLLSERVNRYLPKEERNALRVHTLYAALPPAEQLAAVAPLTSSLRKQLRKVIFSTNIAETSVTIPGIKYVIDSGLAKVRGPISTAATAGVEVDALRLAPVSRAQAEQRRGRAGRLGPGYVFRLYTSEQYTKLDEYPTPELKRADPAGPLLQIIALMGGNASTLKRFPFLDQPPRRAMTGALEALLSLGALDESLQLTLTGRLMARLPVPPRLARTLLEGVRLGVADAVAAVVATLAGDAAVFGRGGGSETKERVRAAHARFMCKYGDHLALKRALEAYVQCEGKKAKDELCRAHFLNSRSLRTAADVRSQLQELLRAQDVQKWARGMRKIDAIEELQEEELVLRCIVAGFFRNVARKTEDGKYALLTSNGAPGEIKVDIHPASTLRYGRRKMPEIVVYDELVVTTKPYLRNVVSVQIDWLCQHSNGYFSKKGTL